MSRSIRGRFGDDADGVAVSGTNLETLARQMERRLDRLVAVGVAGKGDQLAFPAVSVELGLEQGGSVGLDHDLAIEVRSRAEVEVLVRGPGVAVRAGMETAAVRVDAPAE